MGVATSNEKIPEEEEDKQKRQLALDLLVFEATIAGNSQLLQELFSSGANSNCLDLIGQTPLHVAASHGNVEALKVIVESGANLAAKDKEGRTPLHISTSVSRFRENKLEVVKQLLLAGSDPNSKDDAGDTPLHSPARSGDLEVIKLLLKHGAVVNSEGKSGWTPLHLAALSTEPLGLVKILLESGANPNSLDKKGFSPLDLLKYTGKLETKKLLLAKGAKFQHFSGQGTDSSGEGSLEEDKRSPKSSHLQSSSSSFKMYEIDIEIFAMTKNARVDAIAVDIGHRNPVC